MKIAWEKKVEDRNSKIVGCNLIVANESDTRDNWCVRKFCGKSFQMEN